MDSHLSDYLPPVLKNVLEFQAINDANESEISAAWEAVTKLIANQFLETADTDGVSVWESELYIHPKDTDSLEARKTRIKSRWGLKSPYTVTWLRNWLSHLCGPTGYEESLSENTVDIRVDSSALPATDGFLREMLNTLSATCPVNMYVSVTAMQQTNGMLSHSSYTEILTILNVFPSIL